jgi:hypothetical protein
MGNKKKKEEEEEMKISVQLCVRLIISIQELPPTTRGLSERNSGGLNLNMNASW